MSSLSDWAENVAVKHLTKETAYAPSGTKYLALCTADPTDAATGASMNECSNVGNSYARAAITFGTAATNRQIANTTPAVTFTTLTGSAGIATHFAIVDSGTYGAGNVLAHGELAAPKTLVSGNTPSVAIGEIVISWASGVLTNYAANALLNLFFRNTTFTIGTTALGLATVDLDDTSTYDTITEVANTNLYGRLELGVAGADQPSWGYASGNVVTNANQWNMSTPNGTWGTVVAAFIADATTHETVGASNILIYDNGITDQAVNEDDVVYYATNQFSLTIN